MCGLRCASSSRVCLFCSRGMMDENNEQFVAYFLPTPSTIVKRREDGQTDTLFRPEEEYVTMVTEICV